MGHHVHESFALLPLRLCVKFEWSIIKECRNICVKFLKKWSRELTMPTLWPSGALCGSGQLARPKIQGSRNPGHAPFQKNKGTPGLSLEARMTHVKFEVRSFNRFGTINI